jgi:hypothetical protein
MAELKRNLTRKQEEAIVALLSSRNTEEVARACNTPPRFIVGSRNPRHRRISRSAPAGVPTIYRSFTTWIDGRHDDFAESHDYFPA